MNDWKHLQGALFVAFGIYVLLMGTGVLPRNPKDPARMELWRRKFGTAMTIGGPLMILFGILHLVGYFK